MAGRPRKRVNILAESYEKLEDVHGMLKGFDLRQLRGNPELRDAIREARGAVEDAMVSTGEAIQADTPAMSA